MMLQSIERMRPKSTLTDMRARPLPSQSDMIFLKYYKMSFSFIFIPCGNFQFFESEVVFLLYKLHGSCSSRMRKLDYDGSGCEVGSVRAWMKKKAIWISDQRAILMCDRGKERQRERERKKGDKNNTNYLLTVRASQGIIFWFLSQLSITPWMVRTSKRDRTSKKYEHFWSWILLEFVIWTESRLQ